MVTFMIHNIYLDFAGMCAYYHCTLEDWTNWSLIAGSGTCPNEERFRNYRSTKLYKGAHSNCVGIGPNACPAKKREERKKRE